MSKYQMRILHFAQDGDTSGYFPQLAKSHDRARYKMYFGTLNPMAPWLREYMGSQGVECFSSECRQRTEYPLGMIRLAGFLRSHEINILHTHLFEPSVIGLTAGLLARTPTRVLTRHYSDYHTRIQKKWHVRFDRLITSLSHAVIAVSEHTADHMIRNEQAPRDKIHVVLNGIDFDRVKTSAPGAPERIRQEFCSEGGYLLLIVARLHPEKGHHYLFNALRDIQERVGRPVRLLVAGVGTFEAAYKEEVRSLGCVEMVRFLGFRKDIPDLMAAADLVVLPSVAEAFGLVAAEALHLGTPVVATRAGGIPEIIEDGKNGLLVDTGNSEALANAITDLLKDPDRRQEMTRALRKSGERFSFEDMVRSYESIYRRFGVQERKVTMGQPNKVEGG